MRVFLFAAFILALLTVTASGARASGDGCGCQSATGGCCCSAEKSTQALSTILVQHHLPGEQGCSCDTNPALPEPGERAPLTRLQHSDQLISVRTPSATATFTSPAAPPTSSVQDGSNSPRPSFILKCSFVC